MSLARDLVDRIFFPDRDVHAIPVLDGGFSPNQRLEEAEVLALMPSPDALAVAPDGRLFVSSGHSVLTAGEAGDLVPFAELPGPAGALAPTPDGGLLVAVDGLGVAALDRTGRETGRLGEVAGLPLGCVTALAATADGTVFLTDGSRHNGTGRWLEDLMQRRPGSGRLVSCAPDLDDAKVVLDGLSWPAGVCVSHDARHVLVSEAWAHRLLSVSRQDGSIRVLVKNFAGYPSRIAPATGAGYWIAFFALRTQLTEFVLREDAFRSRMMETVPADLWIGPSLGGRFDYREPTQIGRIKKLGIQKPWAPPRSYGLVARVDEAGNAVESLHSRVAGEVHGITGVAERDGRLLVASKGHGKLCRADIGRPS